MEELYIATGNNKSVIEKKRTSIKMENFKSDNMTVTCRVCLHEGDIPIFGNELLDHVSENFCLVTGVKIRTDEKYPQYLCHSCHEQLQSAILFRHTAQETDFILKHKNQEEDNYDIVEEYLELKYNNEDKQNSIFKVTHEDFENNYYCTLCNLNFMSSDKYGKHMLTKKHKNVSDECPFCKRQFKCIKTHLNLHTKQKTIVCEICGQKYLYTTFAQHREIHIDKLKFKCLDCPYSGRSYADLKMHRRRHTGEKPYQCSKCPSRFISKSNLNRHLLTHNNKFKFQCSICNKGYFFKRDLDIHMTWHTGVRDYVCTHCGKCFPHKKALLRHTLNVHKREKMRSGKIPNYIKIGNDNTSRDKSDNTSRDKSDNTSPKHELEDNDNVTKDML